MPSMSNFTSEWNTYKLKTETDRGIIEIKWSDADTLAQWSNIQAGLYLQNEASSRQLFYEHFTRWYQMFWNQRFRQGIFNLSDDAVIMDIGRKDLNSIQVCITIQIIRNITTGLQSLMLLRQMDLNLIDLQF